MPVTTLESQTANEELAESDLLSATGTFVDEGGQKLRRHPRVQKSFNVEIRVDLEETEEILLIQSDTKEVSAFGATLILSCDYEEFALLRAGQRVKLTTSLATALEAEINATWTDPKEAKPEKAPLYLIGVRLMSDGWFRS